MAKPSEEPSRRFTGDRQDPDRPERGFWYAPAAGSEKEDEDEAPQPVSGRVIRVMWDYGVDVPLWDEEGLLPDDPAWLRGELGISDELIEALTALGRDYNAADGTPRAARSITELDQVRHDLNRRGAVLSDWLQREVGARFDVVHHGW